MKEIGLIFTLLGYITFFCTGSYSQKMKAYQFVIIILINLLLMIFGPIFIIKGVEKNTLLKYENDIINYKVTEIRVEDNKAVDIEVIYNNN